MKQQIRPLPQPSGIEIWNIKVCVPSNERASTMIPSFMIIIDSLMKLGIIVRD